jgi:hypoxanthine phosphoribosyltransferase
VDDPASTLLSQQKIQTRVRELGLRIADDFPPAPGGPALWLVGALKGATFFLADLARAIPRDVSVDFVQTSSYGDSTEHSGNVRLLRDLEHDIAGDDVILVEDIVDSGRTARALLELLAARRPRTLKLCTLLDKPSRRVVEIEIDYLGFEIPDQFVVGYGLDYAERYRNLSDIRVMAGPEPPRSASGPASA